MDKLKNYLLELTPERNDLMCSLEQYANKNGVPIMEPVSMDFLTQLIRMHQPSTILEIGTAIGYSALRMHEVQPTATITTLEKNTHMYETALANIKSQNKEASIKVIHGDALETIDQLVAKDEKYDFIFIDAAKGQYERYFTSVQPLTKEQSTIVCDNILFKGYVADASKNDNARLQQLANKIRDFNYWLMEQTNYHTTIIPVGDGVSISVKLT